MCLTGKNTVKVSEAPSDEVSGSYRKIFYGLASYKSTFTGANGAAIFGSEQ